MTDYWRHTGYGLLQRDQEGRLLLTEAFLGAYLQRPELQLVDESCAAEIALFEKLTADPRARVADEELQAMADGDARENWLVFLALRDRLTAAPTIEACYAGLFRDGGAHGVPMLFADQLVQVILRNILTDGADALQARAAEMLFRPQKVMRPDGALIVGDRKIVDMLVSTGGYGDLGRLLVQAQAPMHQVEMAVLRSGNKNDYWARDEAFDLALDLGPEGDGLPALCAVLEKWVDHMVGAAVDITPLQSIDDDRWSWHVGLDAEATAILNALYEAGGGAEAAAQARLLSLFRLEFRDPTLMAAAVAGRPVYLGLAMDDDGVVRLKPQNLIVNLPLAEKA